MGRMLWNQKVAALMAARGMTQTQLADATGLSRSAVSRLLAGLRTPRMDNLRAIAEALGVDPGQLIADDPRWITDPTEKALLELWRRVPEEKRQTVLDMLSALKK